MDVPPIGPIAVLDGVSQAALRDPNNANADATSFLTPEVRRGLVAVAFAAP